jgi:putative GTP pyrophosphokinase
LHETPSKTQIDRLGDRLRDREPSASDLRLLDDYRRSFGDAYESVVLTIRERLQLQATGRPAKSTISLREKLRRESVRLSQVQDIAGCRVVVDDIAAQERVIDALLDLFPRSVVVDRRAAPSHGYRAVHVIATILGKPVEMQVRSSSQHLWAELSEKLSDVFDPAIKYGGGDEEIRQILQEGSAAVAMLEGFEKQLLTVEGEHSMDDRLDVMREQIARLKGEMVAIFTRGIARLEEIGRRK